jgi:hypothetical protein
MATVTEVVEALRTHADEAEALARKLRQQADRAALETDARTVRGPVVAAAEQSMEITMGLECLRDLIDV